MRELDALAYAVGLPWKQSTDTLHLSAIQQFSQEKGTRISYQNLFFDLDDYVSHACADTLAYTLFSACIDRTVLYADATDRYLSNVAGVWQSFLIKQYCGLAAYIPGACADEMIDTYYKSLSWYEPFTKMVDKMPVIVAD